jgi:WhiB family redox-sensing transcriptional regulator
LLSGAAIGQPVRELERRVLSSPRPCTARPEDWFAEEPDARSGRAREIYEALARALCRGCPVASECLELAIQREGARPGFGVVGGVASWQRQDIKRGRGWSVPRRGGR